MAGQNISHEGHRQRMRARVEPVSYTHLYLLSFLAGRLYTILWKYAGERDLIRLAGMIAVPTGIVYLVNRCFIHGVLPKDGVEPPGQKAEQIDCHDPGQIRVEQGRCV